MGPRFVRIEAHQGDWTLSFARALWRAIGEPGHVDLHRAYDGLQVVADASGYAVTGGTSTPRVKLTQEQAAPLGLPLGHYHATVDNGRIVTTFERDPAHGRRVYLVCQRGQWRIRTDRTGGTILWHAETTWDEEDVIAHAQAWCAERDCRLVKPPKWEW